MTLVFEYPFWLVLLCLLLGAAGSFFLYYFGNPPDVSRGLKYFLVILRFTSIFLISFLLLSPLLRQNLETIEKPLIILGIDNSESIVLTKDSGFYRNTFSGQVRTLIERLNKDYEVKAFSLGEEVKPYSGLSYNQKQTDLSTFFREIEDRFMNRNVGAIILASDGIYNKGTDPFYASEKLPFSIYCIPMGDTVQHQDILLKKAECNSTVFIGDRFPLEIYYSAYFCQGKKTQLSVSHKGKVLFTKEILPVNEEMNAEEKIYLDANEAGQQVYDIRIIPVEGEVSTLNNFQRISIQVLNSREKIAILYNAPHPDVTAIEQALMKTGRYEISVSPFDVFSESPEKFSLLILHMVPSIQHVTDLDPILKPDIPALFILGTQTDLSAFNKINTGLIISAVKSNFTEAQPVWNDVFSLFTLDHQVSSAFSIYPPLMSPLGSYQYNPLIDVLCYQQIGSVSTRIPQIMFTTQNNRKTGIIAGENIWKWRIAEFVARSNHDAFDELINKMVQLLSVKADKSFFRVKVNDPVRENEGVKFVAEVYNDSYELINDPDVNIVITDSGQRIYPFLFNKTERAYQLHAGIFPLGTYKYNASVKFGNKQYRESGTFIVMPVNNEAINLVANHQILYMISSAHEGSLILPAKLETIQDILKSREDIHSVTDIQKRFTDLIGNPWLLAALLILLSAEWIIRKRSGL